MQLGKYAEYVVISNIDVFRAKLEKLKLGGYEQLHVVSDFDWTISKQFNSVNQLSSSYGLIKHSKFLIEKFIKNEKEL